jgi:hypothetical protein
MDVSLIMLSVLGEQPASRALKISVGSLLYNSIKLVPQIQGAAGDIIFQLVVLSRQL